MAIERPDWTPDATLPVISGHDSENLPVASYVADPTASDHSVNLPSAGSMKLKWSPEEIRDSFDISVLQQWGSAGGVQHHHRQAQKSAAAAISAVPAADRPAFMQSFDGLPGQVRGALIMELSLGTRRAVTLDQDELDEMIKSSSVIAELAKEWGGRARKYFGICIARMEALSASMPEADYATAQRWLRGLPASQQKAALKALIN